jgi:predicted transcriptional regulator
MFTIKITLDEPTAARFDRLMDYLEGQSNQAVQRAIDEQVAKLRAIDDAVENSVKEK